MSKRGKGRPMPARAKRLGNVRAGGRTGSYERDRMAADRTGLRSQTSGLFGDWPGFTGGPGAGSGVPGAGSPGIPGGGAGGGAGAQSLLAQMGGLDGILSTMGKIQKVMGMVQQFAPMFRMLSGLGGGLTASTSATARLSARRPVSKRPGSKGKSRHPRPRRK